MDRYEILKPRFRRLVVGVGVVLVALATIGHYGAGPEISFSLLYLLPVSLVVWYVGTSAGVAIALASSVSWLMADHLAGHTYANPWIPYFNFMAKSAVYLVVAVVAARLKSAYAEEKHHARRDSLTGVGNLRAFHEFAERELHQARQYAGSLTMVYFDIDDFKKVNDSFGHGTGNAVLRLIADTVRSHLRDTDMVARLGGDEFAILLPGRPLDRSRDLVEYLQEELLREMRKRQWQVTLSIGVALFAKPPATVEDLLRKGDELMYEVKKSGKNNIRYATYGALSDTVNFAADEQRSARRVSESGDKEGVLHVG